MTDVASKKAVLLVDDDKFLLDMYLMKFQQAGYDVHACLSVADALKALRDGFSPSAVVFDLIMPGGDGFFLLDSLKKEKLAPDAPKIALTNEMSDDEKKRVSELGGTRYLVKAMMIPSEVVDAVAAEIAKKK